MPSEAGQTAIAVLVGDGLIVVVDFCIGVDDTTGSELLLLNGAQADSNNAIAKNGSKRRGICIGNSYLSCITVTIKLMNRFDNLF
ncbi:MAG TPA: hypothetical protein VIX20_14655 [Ktedonobacteraceae bacterium]